MFVKKYKSLKEAEKLVGFLSKICKVLKKNRVKYIVIGGIAIKMATALQLSVYTNLSHLNIPPFRQSLEFHHSNLLYEDFPLRINKIA